MGVSSASDHPSSTFLEVFQLLSILWKYGHQNQQQSCSAQQNHFYLNILKTTYPQPPSTRIILFNT